MTPLSISAKVFVAVAALALSIAACGGQSSSAAAPTASAATTPASASASDAPAANNAASSAAVTGTTAVTETAAVSSAAASADAPADAPASAGAAIASKVNLNTATEAQLVAAIPGFGGRMVREFFEYRPYVSIEQFRKEIGKYVDAAQVATYEQYVFVPVAPNDSDAATLQQLPGVNAEAASKLVAGRPYASSEAFLAALGALVTPEEQAAAAAMLGDQ